MAYEIPLKVYQMFEKVLGKEDAKKPLRYSRNLLMNP